MEAEKGVSGMLAPNEIGTILNCPFPLDSAFLQTHLCMPLLDGAGRRRRTSSSTSPSCDQHCAGL